MRKTRYDGVGLLMVVEGMPQRYWNFLDTFSSYFTQVTWLHTTVNQERYTNKDSVSCIISNPTFKRSYLCYIVFIDELIIITIADNSDHGNYRVATADFGFVRPQKMRGLLKSMFRSLEPEASIRRFPWK